MEAVKNSVKNPVEKIVAAATETSSIIIEGCVIKQVSSPATIQRVAVDKGINPQEVFVRVVFTHNGQDFLVANKLRFLTKAGYNELLEAQKNKTALKLAVNTESGFFYIEKDVNVDDLFKDAVKPSAASKLTDLAKLIV
jgi:hypothetical protein